MTLAPRSGSAVNITVAHVPPDVAEEEQCDPNKRRRHKRTVRHGTALSWLMAVLAVLSMVILAAPALHSTRFAANAFCDSYFSGSADITAKASSAQDGSHRLTFEGHTGRVQSVAFSPDGTRVAAGYLDGTVKVWDTTSGQELFSLKGMQGYFTPLAFSPDGKRIVAGTNAFSVKVWDAQSGAELLTLNGHTNFVISAAFSPDSKQIATSSVDNIVRVWDAQTGKELMHS